MRNVSILSVMAVVGALLAGCMTPEGRPNYTASGALLGGAIGAGTGALIGGGHHHHSETDALIGGAVGALAGGAIGYSMDLEQAQRDRLEARAPETWQYVERGRPLGLADIKALARAGLSDEVIISQIRASRTVYHLTTAEVLDLKESGVSDRVIDFMINSGESYVGAPWRG